MQKIIKALLFGSLLLGSLVGCNKETNNGTNNNQNSSTENNTNNDIVEPKLTGIALNTDNVKKAYTYGDALNLTGLVVNANYDDNTSKAVTSYTTAPANGAALNSVGDVAVTVTYEGKTASFNISVTKVLTGITLNTDNVKKTYGQGETLDLTGLVVSASYNDNSTAVVTNYTTNPANDTALNELGDKEIAVTYEGKTEKYTITVNKVLTGITINKDSLQKEYTWGSPFWAIGLVVTAHYSDGSTETVPSTDYTISPEERSGLIIPGEQTVTVSYGGFTDSYTINVDKTAKSIYLVTDNVKTNYHYGEKFTSAGLLVNTKYANNTAELINDYTLSIEEDTELKTPGTQTVTVTYNDCTTSYDINVDGGEVFIDDSEVKKLYTYGEALDFAGLKVGYRYSDGTVEYTDDYTTDVEEGTIYDFVGGWTIGVDLTDHSNDNKHFSFRIDSEGYQETGTRLTISFARMYHFGDYGMLTQKVRPSDGSNYEATFRLHKESTAEDAMTLRSGNKLRFLEGDYVENITSLGGVTKITVNGGNRNYRLFVGYSPDNMAEFLMSSYEEDGSKFIYSNIPNINYFRLVGIDDGKPADISSIEFDYTRDENHNLVDGVPSPVSDDFSNTATFFNGNGYELTLRRETIIIGTNTYSFAGINFNGFAIYYDSVTNSSIGIKRNGSSSYLIMCYSNYSADYAGTYSIAHDATVLTMYINGESVEANAISNRREITWGSSFNFTAESNAYPSQPVDIELVNENTSGNAPATFENGVVTANNEGNFKILCRANSYLAHTLYFTVLPYVPATVSLDYDSLLLNQGDSFYIDPTVNSDASNKTLTFTSNNENVVSVNENIITAVSSGKATINIETIDGSSVKLFVKVNGSTEEIIYNFNDVKGKKHVLVIHPNEVAYLDNVNEFYYSSFNGHDYYAYKYDTRTGFEIRLSENDEYIDFFDFNNLLFSEDGLVSINAGDYMGSFTLSIAPYSQGSMNQGGGEISIVDPPVTKDRLFIFYDIDEIEHLIILKENKEMFIDGYYVFKYSSLGEYCIYLPNRDFVYATLIEGPTGKFLKMGGSYTDIFDLDGPIQVELQNQMLEIFEV